MSSNNYGEKDLKIVIPIEIVPEAFGISDAIKETKERIKQGGSEKFYNDSVFVQMDDQKILSSGLPKGRAESMPSDGNSPLNTLRRTTAKSGLLQGVPPTNPNYIKTSVGGTANVPQGGNAPINKNSYKAKPPMFKNTIPAPAEEPGMFESILSKVLGGPASASKGLAMLKNPLALAKYLGPVAGPVLAGFVAIEVTKKVINELVRKGSIYDRTFKNVIDTRNEALRTREQQQKILVGFGDGAQLITTTSAGTTSPRDSYNTYEQFNHNQAVLEEKFAIRNDSGYD